VGWVILTKTLIGTGGGYQYSRSHFLRQPILIPVILMGKQLNKYKTNKMKKVIFALVIATSLVACGGSTSTEVTTDSTVVAVDTTAVAVDSAVAPAVDTTIAK